MVWEGEARGFRPFREKNQKGFKKEAIRYPPLCSLAASECPLLRLDFAFFCISNEEARLGLPNLSDWAEKLPLLSMNLLIWSSEKSVCTITAKLSTQLLFSWQFVPLYNLTIYWQDAICFFGTGFFPRTRSSTTGLFSACLRPRLHVHVQWGTKESSGSKNMQIQFGRLLICCLGKILGAAKILLPLYYYVPLDGNSVYPTQPCIWTFCRL